MNKAERKEYLASLEGAILSDEEWARELYGSVVVTTENPLSSIDSEDNSSDDDWSDQVDAK